MHKIFAISLLISFWFCAASAFCQQSSTQQRAEKIAVAFNKQKDKVKEKSGFEAERYYRKVQGEPVIKQDIKDYTGEYEMPGLDFTVNVQVASDGTVKASGFESSTGSKTRRARRFSLENARVEDALLTGTKVYEDGMSEKFEGVFMNRTIFNSPTDKGITVFGLGVAGVSVEFEGIVFQKLFYEKKGGKSIAHNDSENVRKAVETWYAKNTEAFQTKDVAAVMALRADDFHTVLPDGTKNTRADMQVYTERLLGKIEQWLSLDFQIGMIDVQDKFEEAKGEFASAFVTQKTVRMQRLTDGQLHKVESGAVQRETWKKTAEGWKLYRVDSIRDTGLYIDGNLVRRPQ